MSGAAQRADDGQVQDRAGEERQDGRVDDGADRDGCLGWDEDGEQEHAAGNAGSLEEPQGLQPFTRGRGVRLKERADLVLDGGKAEADDRPGLLVDLLEER